MQTRPVVQLMMMGCLVGWLVMTPLWTLAKPTKDGRYRRTASPQSSVSKSSDTFFQDAFQEGLQGNRPATLNKTRTVSPDVATSPATHSDEGETNSYAWSTIIYSTTIEDEIKNLRQAVDKTITKPGTRNSMAIKKIPKPNQRLKARFSIASDLNRHTSQLM